MVHAVLVPKRTLQSEADAVMLRALLTGSRRGLRIAARSGSPARPSDSSGDAFAQPLRKGSGEVIDGMLSMPTSGRMPPTLEPEL